MRGTLCLLFLLFSASGVAGADNFVPFVIPAKPNPDSTIAVLSTKPIDIGSDRLIADSHFYCGGQRVRLWGSICHSEQTFQNMRMPHSLRRV